jgi:hypothetical protein
MANTPQIIGTPNDVIWGTNNVYSTGRIIKSRMMGAIESDPSLDNNGVQTGEIIIIKPKVYDFDMEYQSSLTPPSEGDQNVTIQGNAGCIIDSSEIQYTRGKRGVVSIKAHAYVA